jgi:hypothetical protein
MTTQVAAAGSRQHGADPTRLMCAVQGQHQGTVLVQYPTVTLATECSLVEHLIVLRVLLACTGASGGTAAITEPAECLLCHDMRCMRMRIPGCQDVQHFLGCLPRSAHNEDVVKLGFILVVPVRQRLCTRDGHPGLGVDAA